MNELALFAGGGGGILGGLLLGWRTVCAVEFDAAARAVLLARQRDGILAPFPIWDDVRTFDGTVWRGRVDVVSGGFPCQDISSAGKQQGLAGSRSGLWSHMARIIGEVRPRYAWVENSPNLVRLGLDVVLRDLAAMGYDAEWGVVSAENAGAPHKRERIWILAHAVQMGLHRPKFADVLPDGSFAPESQSVGEVGRTKKDGCAYLAYGDGSNGARGRKGDEIQRPLQPHLEGHNQGGWQPEPRLDLMAHGVADRMGELAILGNGQVPAVVKLAWDTLYHRAMESIELKG